MIRTRSTDDRFIASLMESEDKWLLVYLKGGNLMAKLNGKAAVQISTEVSVAVQNRLLGFFHTLRA